MQKRIRNNRKLEDETCHWRKTTVVCPDCMWYSEAWERSILDLPKTKHEPEGNKDGARDAPDRCQ